MFSRISEHQSIRKRKAGIGEIEDQGDSGFLMADFLFVPACRQAGLSDAPII
jgi:hypothetical protein